MIRLGNSKIAKSAFIDVTGNGQLTLGNNCEVRHNAVLEVAGKVTIADNVVIGVGNWLQGSGEITIHKNVIIGPHCNIVSTSHKYADVKKPIVEQGLEYGKITIEQDAWIGAGVTIAMNVTIGKGAIIGANSFVNKDVEPFAIYAGSPAVKIKSRK